MTTESWVGSSGAFSTLTNWKSTTNAGNTVPGPSDSADFGSGVSSGATITGGGTVYDLTVEASLVFSASITATAIGNTGTVTLTAGSLTSLDSFFNGGSLTVVSGFIGSLYFTNDGVVQLEAGGTLRNTGYLGDNGYFAVADGGWVDASDGLSVGDTGAGTLAVTGGGSATDSFAIVGNQAGSSGTAVISGTDANWWNDGALTVAQNGAGSVLVQNDGTFSAEDLYAGVAAGASGSFIVSGPGSNASIAQSMLIGESGNGTVTVQDAATVWLGAAAIVGELIGGEGILSVSGGSVSVGQALIVGNAGSGSLAVSNAGSVYATNILVGDGAGSTGNAVINGPQSELAAYQSVYIGASGEGQLLIDSGGTTVSSVSVDIGASAGSSGTVTVSGSASELRATAALVVGDEADGTLAIENQATATASILTVGNVSGSAGTVTVSGSGALLAVTVASIGGNWEAAGGTGLLNLSSGGVMTSTGWTNVWNRGTIQLSGGALVTQAVDLMGCLAGYGTVETSSTLADYQIMNDGSIFASGGTLDLIGTVTQTGTLAIASGAELLLQDPVANTQTVIFESGSDETLTLADPAMMQASIMGFAAGDTIDLLGVTINTLQFINGTLTAIGPGGPDNTLRAVGSFLFGHSYSLGEFSVSTSAQGNSYITFASTDATTTTTTSSAASGPSESTYLETNRFFASTSPWNTPITSDAGSSAIPGIGSVIAGLTGWDPSSGSVAIYYAQTSDPLVPVLYNPETYSMVASGSWLRTGNTAAVEQQILATSSATDPIPANPYSTSVAGLTWNSTPSGLPDDYNQWVQGAGQTLYIYAPSGITPTASSDGQTVIIQPDGMAIELYSPIVLSTGQIVSSAFSATNALSGSGTGEDNGRTASMIENYAGVLRDIDVTSGTIDHALAIVVPQSMLTAAVTGPALAFDANTTGYTGSLAMGSHLALPSTLNISSLDLLTALGNEIAQAAQTYGEFIVDSGGSGISIVTQNDPTSAALNTWSSALQSDLNTIFQHEVLLPS
jgi:T5SS/PEP-CTERM-associated repeat protein